MAGLLSQHVFSAFGHHGFDADCDKDDGDGDEDGVDEDD